MVYTCKYRSLIGDILLAADEIGLEEATFLQGFLPEIKYAQP